MKSHTALKIVPELAARWRADLPWKSGRFTSSFISMPYLNNKPMKLSIQIKLVSQTTNPYIHVSKQNSNDVKSYIFEGGRT